MLCYVTGVTSVRCARGIRKEIIRFMTAGILVNATDFGLYYILILALPFSLAKTISFTCAGIVAYLFNKRWIFRYSETATAPELGRYLLTNVVTLGLNVAINQRILEVWPGAVLPAISMAAILTGAVTFVSYKWWVFKKRAADRRSN